MVKAITPNETGLKREFWFPFTYPELPLNWRKPREVVVSALFTLEATAYDIDCAFAVMALCPEHQFIIGPHRPEHIAAYLQNEATKENVEYRVATKSADWTNAYYRVKKLGGVYWPGQKGEWGRYEVHPYFEDVTIPWPLPNVEIAPILPTPDQAGTPNA